MLHTGLVPVVIAMLTDGVTRGVTVRVMAELVAVVGVAQVALEVRTQRIRSPFTKATPATPV